MSDTEAMRNLTTKKKTLSEMINFPVQLNADRRLDSIAKALLANSMKN